MELVMFRLNPFLLGYFKSLSILWTVRVLKGIGRAYSKHFLGVCMDGLKVSTIFFYYLVCEAIGTAATPGLLCQPRVIVKMIVEKQMECRVAGEAEVLGENLPQRHFCPSQNPT
jgi:hypothetical protein